MQPDKAAPVTYAATLPNGESYGLMVRLNSTSMGSSFSNNQGARQLFSDRKNGPQPLDQPFSINNPSYMHHQVDQDGKVWFISRTTGAVVGQISNPVCENGLLYGWGPSLSTFNSPTMYVFRFFQGIILN
ncbi:hypothetical protein [Cystobacter fuscus]|uniref:hypothetical protein n=1 Tax=Cystobacter fuscus TaxID=43 RepID=UPI002B2FE2AF|nr:hypothetical protein F0U63_11165 [Cystobacter fuscus]